MARKRIAADIFSRAPRLSSTFFQELRAGLSFSWKRQAAKCSEIAQASPRRETPLDGRQTAALRATEP
jgi:hypothetical protein